MRGKSYSKICAQWQKYAVLVEDRLGYEVIDNICHEFKDNADGRALYYLGHSLQKMSEADVAIFFGRWKESDGCQIEFETAKRYGVPIVLHMGGTWFAELPGMVNQ
jgi:hypothetical protein